MATVTLDTESDAATVEAWQRALDAWRETTEYVAQVDREWDAIQEAYERLRPDDGEIEPIIKKHFPHLNVRAVAHWTNLEELWEQFMAGENKTWWGADRKAETRSGLDLIADWRTRRTRAAEVTGYDKAAEESDVAGDRETEAFASLMKTPSANAEGAALKLELLFGPDKLTDGRCESWNAELVAPAIADAKRFLSTSMLGEAK